MTTTSTPRHILDWIIDYENGDLSEEETITFFQELVESGLAWQLQGHYGRTAAALLDVGLIEVEGWAKQ